MEPKTSYLYVGVAVLAMIVAAVLLTLWFVAARDSAQLSHYTIYFKEQSLRGLQRGSTVTMRGIPIGVVESLQILPVDSAGVRVEIQVDSDSPIIGNTSAIIERNLLTGLATIEISKMPSDATAPVRMMAGELYPVIPEGSPKLQLLADSASEILDNLNLTLQRIEEFLGEENREAFSRVLANLEKLSENAAQERGVLFEASRELTQAIPKILRFLAGATASIESSSERLISTLEQYQEPRSLVFGPAAETLGPGE